MQAEGADDSQLLSGSPCPVARALQRRGQSWRTPSMGYCPASRGPGRPRWRLLTTLTVMRGETYSRTAPGGRVSTAEARSRLGTWWGRRLDAETPATLREWLRYSSGRTGLSSGMTKTHTRCCRRSACAWVDDNGVAVEHVKSSRTLIAKSGRVMS